ncbi:hypothetical protein HHK36_011251 [Tetracentron sinense]|uniref:PWWP domain-containing protein n=1 Tax=Tetracentron sinense TaxID=13715 RepID=A0A834Z8U3_TETSI|nr:hypothetical protein HHK36_011251 [Tetracentron sinense]
MAKNKASKKRKREKSQQVDYIPKCFQQPRSRGPKPRTDFSLFVCSSSSSSLSFLGSRRHRDSMLEFSRCKDGLSSITAASLDQACQTPVSGHEKEIPEFPLVACTTSQIGGQERLFSNSMGVPFTKVESVDKNIGGYKSDTAGPLEFTLNKSQFTESNNVWKSPRSVVWAKTACQMWWPAEVGYCYIRLATQCEIVIVHIYSAWEKSSISIPDSQDFASPSVQCFEERSCNPVQAFQDALKQALHIKEHIGSCRQLDENADGLISIQHYHSSEKWNSSSSRTEGDHLEGGKGKRKRKPKVYFDEVIHPTKSVKKVRRFRIMRYLGLTAPIGSPFSLTSHVRTAYKSCRVLNV